MTSPPSPASSTSHAAERPADPARAERRLHALVEASTDVVWFADGDGLVDDIPGWRALTGQSRDQVRGRGWLAALHPDDSPLAAAAWDAAVAARGLYECEYRLRMRDGQYRWFRARGVPILVDDRIDEWIGVLDDVHDERTATERLALLADASIALAASLDWETTLQRVVEHAVPRFSDWCFLELRVKDGSIQPLAIAHREPAKVAIGWEYYRRWPLDPDAPFGSPQVIRSAEPALVPAIPREALDAVLPDPEQRAIFDAMGFTSHVAVPLVVRGTAIGVLTFVMAESGRSLTEADVPFAVELGRRATLAIENARLYAEAQAANRAKADFLAVMSHELRTPLNAIGGYAELLEDGIRGPVTPEQKLDLSRIRRSQRHLVTIITDILAFSRLEAGSTEVAVEAVALGDAIAAVAAMIEPQASAKGLRFDVTAVDPALLVCADPDKLRQILLNLLSNAVKFTAAGGAVAVRVAPGDTTVTVTVHDTGIGIPAEQQEAIFAPFVQLDRSLTRAVEGTGLGLAISRHLAEMMGASLRVESEIGVGSVFSLELRRSERDG